MRRQALLCEPEPALTRNLAAYAATPFTGLVQRYVTVADKLELGRAGRMLSRALWAAWDPQGVQDAIDRELVMAMPWLAGPPAPFEAPDGWPA